jgi:hypothetical protein
MLVLKVHKEGEMSAMQSKGSFVNKQKWSILEEEKMKRDKWDNVMKGE